MEAVSDDATELEPAVPEPTGAAPRRGCGMLALPVIAVAAILTLVLSVGAWAALRTNATVPDITGLSVPVATEQIAAAQLSTATMVTVATSEYESGVVVQQLPTGRSRAPIGTPVDLLVAVTPTTTVVPDVSLDTTLVAQSTLGYALLRPVIYQQLSDTVPFGRVAAQMPRAGERVMTGQQVALFVSIGRGTGGAVVPSVLGATISEAGTRIADVYLVALVFNAQPGMSLSGTVTDQVPAPGTRVPIGSGIPLITTGKSN